MPDWTFPLRVMVRLLPARLPVPILSGPNLGLWWRAGASVPHCVLGTYEAAKCAAVRRAIRPGMTVWDIGANMGYYALLAARCVGPRGAVIAFEPLPSNVAGVLDHARMNRLSRITLLAAAAGATPGLGTFRIATSNAEGRLDPGPSPLTVARITLDGYLHGGARPPHVVKMDVEGGEADVLRGAAGLLARRRTAWFVAVHGRIQRTRCARTFAAHGYEVRTLAGERDLTGAEDLVAFPVRVA